MSKSLLAMYNSAVVRTAESAIKYDNQEIINYLTKIIKDDGDVNKSRSKCIRKNDYKMLLQTEMIFSEPIINDNLGLLRQYEKHFPLSSKGIIDGLKIAAKHLSVNVFAYLFSKRPVNVDVSNLLNILAYNFVKSYKGKRSSHKTTGFIGYSKMERVDIISRNKPKYKAILNIILDSLDEMEYICIEMLKINILDMARNKVKQENEKLLLC